LIERDATYDPKRQEVMNAFVDNTANTQFPAPTCLGCAEFFYANQNIYKPEVCKHPIALLGSISQISNNTANIKD
jgi:hypothetical protein